MGGDEKVHSLDRDNDFKIYTYVKTYLIVHFQYMCGLLYISYIFIKLFKNKLLVMIFEI